MEKWEDRTVRLIGKENFEKIKEKVVLIFGVGGVGGIALEALVRSGISNIGIVNMDKVSVSNINRQIIANTKTVGKYKTDVFKERLKDINPDLNIYALNKKITIENLEEIIKDVKKHFGKIDYIIDAIDDVPVKIENIIYCAKEDINLIVSMGAGFKMDTSKVRVSNIFKTKSCKLAKKIRKSINNFLKNENILNKENFKKIIAVYSEEETMKAKVSDGKNDVASMMFVPASFGLKIAELVIKDIIEV